MSLHKALTAAARKDRLSAERAAYRAYDSRVAEMMNSGQGVIAHNGNNQKMIVSYLISLLASNDREHFSEEVQTIRKKAIQDPVHYSPLAYALSVAEGSFCQACPVRVLSV